MEQKDLDEINESFLGEEILDEDIMQKISLESKAKKPAQKRKTTKKVEATKTMTKEAQTPIPEVQIIQDDVKKPTAEIKVEKVADVKKEETKSTIVNNEVKIESATSSASSSTITNPWDDEEETSGFFKEASTWKALTGILVILLIFSVFTSGFNLSDSTGALIGTEGQQITLAEAQDKTLDYVNSNLLAPPFNAELESSEELSSLYRITLQVAGQSIDSYITKDGELFFPQGFDLTGALVQEETQDSQLQEPVVVSIDDDPMKGDVNAPVTIVEFSDFECPYCGVFYSQTLSELMENYVDTGKVRLVFRDFPLDIHANAKPASLAAECADDQGKFWEYHDALFEDQENLGDELYFEIAQELSLDETAFRDCYYTETHSAEIDADFQDGTSYGVSGTPAFFINGKLISGAQPYTVFAQEIDAALSMANSAQEPTTEILVEEPEVEVVDVEPVVVEPVVEVVSGEVVTVNVGARKWLFNPRKVTVNLGDTLKLNIVPEGLDFTFSLSEFGVEQEIRGPTTVEIVATQTGTFDFTCSSCEDWRGMTGQLTVE